MWVCMAMYDLDLETRNLPTYEGFKKKMKQMYGNSSYSMFMYGDTNGSINHSRIRMGLSGLNAHQRKLILSEMLLVVTAQIDQKVHVTISSSALPLRPNGKTSSMT